MTSFTLSIFPNPLEHLMLDDETLDVMADTYVPLLTLLALGGGLGGNLARRRWPELGRRALLFFCGAVVAYGLMFIDGALNIWSPLGLDYSTHSAVAFVLVAFLSVVVRKLWLFWVLSLVVYILLMLYQRYHTVLDVVTTLTVVAACYLPLVVWHQRGYTVRQRTVHRPD